MLLKIGGKDYKLEYTFEAVLHEKCVEKVVELFGSIAAANEAEEGTVSESIAKDAFKQMVGIPKTAITLFYAGLLEHNPVETEEDAKALLKQYFKENPEAEYATFYGMLTGILGQMEEDGFFKQIGLVEEPESQPKEPQDHKKKAPEKRATAKSS